MVKNLTTEEFKEQIFNYEENEEWKFNGKTPTIIDFYSDWCGPCKTIEPLLKEIDEEFNGKINIIKINVEKEPDIAAAFGIRGIPSLLLVPMDGQPQMVQGALPKETLVGTIQDVMKVSIVSESEN